MIHNENIMCFLGSLQIHVNNELSINSDHSVGKWNKFLWVICCHFVVILLTFVDLSMKLIQQLHLRWFSLWMKTHQVISPQMGFSVDETHPATSPQMGFLVGETLPVTLSQIGFLVDEATSGHFISEEFPYG
jgi:hypothetical protein